MDDDSRRTQTKVLIARGTVEITQALRKASEAATTGRCVLVAGIVYAPGRAPGPQQRWLVSLSQWGQVPVPVSEHQYLRDAVTQARRVYAVSGRYDLCDGATFASVIRGLAAFGDREAE